jgi:hypothetical protein
MGQSHLFQGLELKILHHHETFGNRVRDRRAGGEHNPTAAFEHREGKGQGLTTKAVSSKRKQESGVCCSAHLPSAERLGYLGRP